LWQRAHVFSWGRIGFITLAAVMALNQSMFVGIYAALRLPVALRIQPPESYHATPTMNGAYYIPCMYIRTHLRPGEKYLSLVRPHFYYCPQASAQLELLPGEEKSWIYETARLPQLSLPEFIDFFDKNSFRFVGVTTALENRRNATGHSDRQNVDFGSLRFGQFIIPAVQNLKPLAQDGFAAVYDGRDVLDELKKMSQR